MIVASTMYDSEAGYSCNVLDRKRNAFLQNVNYFSRFQLLTTTHTGVLHSVAFKEECSSQTGRTYQIGSKTFSTAGSRNTIAV